MRFLWVAFCVGFMAAGASGERKGELIRDEPMAHLLIDRFGARVEDRRESYKVYVFEAERVLEDFREVRALDVKKGGGAVLYKIESWVKSTLDGKPFEFKWKKTAPDGKVLGGLQGKRDGASFAVTVIRPDGKTKQVNVPFSDKIITLHTAMQITAANNWFKVPRLELQVFDVDDNPRLFKPHTVTSVGTRQVDVEVGKLNCDALLDVSGRTKAMVFLKEGRFIMEAKPAAGGTSKVLFLAGIKKYFPDKAFK